MTSKAIVALLALTALYLALQGLRWAARVWGVEAVGVFLALPVLAIPAVALWGLRIENKRATEPWMEIPWEVRR